MHSDFTAEFGGAAFRRSAASVAGQSSMFRFAGKRHGMIAWVDTAHARQERRGLVAPGCIVVFRVKQTADGWTLPRKSDVEVREASFVALYAGSVPGDHVEELHGLFGMKTEKASQVWMLDRAGATIAIGRYDLSRGGDHVVEWVSSGRGPRLSAARMALVAQTVAWIDQTALLRHEKATSGVRASQPTLMRYSTR